MRKTVTTTMDGALRETAKDQKIPLNTALEEGIKLLLTPEGKMEYLIRRKQELLTQVATIDMELDQLRNRAPRAMAKI